MENYTIKEKIAYVLKELGCPVQNKGWRYLSLAIELVVDEPGYLDAMTKWLYPTLAKRFDTTISRVERAMRHEVELIFDNCPVELLHSTFGNTANPWSGKVSNSAFIATVVSLLTVEEHHPIWKNFGVCNSPLI